jgi:hypothetical protein
MEDWMKYLVWIGWFLAVIGYWVGSQTLVWIALAELVIGILMGIFAFKEEIKGLFERAVFYSVTYGIVTIFGLDQAIGFALMEWIATYLGLMAWIYVPAAILQYIAKVFKEGY